MPCRRTDIQLVLDARHAANGSHSPGETVDFVREGGTGTDLSASTASLTSSLMSHAPCRRGCSVVDPEFDDDLLSLGALRPQAVLIENAFGLAYILLILIAMTVATLSGPDVAPSTCWNARATASSSNPPPKDDVPDAARFSEHQATAKELIDSFQLRVYRGASTISRQRSPLRIGLVADAAEGAPC